MIQRYVRKPQVVEAIQFNGINTKEITEFTDNKAISFYDRQYMILPGEEESKKIYNSDWVIKECHGNFTVCNKVQFKLLYDLSE